MANINLDLAPTQSSSSTAPGVSASGLARVMAVRLPAGAPRGASAQARLSAAIARLPSTRKKTSSLFLP